MKSDETYNIKAILHLTNGSIDISKYVLEVQIVYSLNLAIPQVAIIAEKNITKQFKKNIESLELEVHTYKHFQDVKKIDTYYLIPLETRTTLPSPDQNIVHPLLNKTYDSSVDYLLFLIGPCYNAATDIVGPLLLFNTKISDILNKIKPENTEYLINSDLNNHIIPQIYIRKQSFLEAINYISYWYSLSKGPVCKSIIPMEDNSEKSIVIINDVRQNMSEAEDYSKRFILRHNLMNETRKIFDEIKQQEFVIDYPIQFSKNIIQPTEFTLVLKPYSYLSKINKYSETDIINKYGAVYKNLNPELENMTGINNTRRKIFIGHTFYDVYDDPVISLITYDYMFSTRGLIRFEQLPNFHFIWPAEQVYLDITNPDQIYHEGIYVVESVLYRLTKLKSLSWQMSAEVSIVRSNMFNKTEDFEIKQTTPEINEIPEPNLNSAKTISKSLQSFDNNINNLRSSVFQYQSFQSDIGNIMNDWEGINDDINQYLNDSDFNLQNAENYVYQILNVLTNIDDIVNAVQNLDSSIYSLYNIVNLFKNYLNVDFTNYLNTILGLSTILGNIENNILNMKNNLKLDLNSLSNFSYDFSIFISSISQIGALPKDNYVTSFAQKLSQTLYTTQNVVNNIRYDYNSVSRSIQYLKDGSLSSKIYALENIIDKTEYYHSILDNLLSNGPYEDGDQDFIKSFISEKIDLDIIRYTLNNVQNITSDLSSMYTSLENLYNSVGSNYNSFNSQLNNIEYYLQINKRYINSIANGLIK